MPTALTTARSVMTTPVNEDHRARARIESARAFALSGVPKSVRAAAARLSDSAENERDSPEAVHEEASQRVRPSRRFARDP